ncbi:MAG TPA: hypothetical protein VMI11_10190 [Actinomycetes bacterium]|nr:hypothetical protein [Actinomycetes bacterium]
MRTDTQLVPALLAAAQETTTGQLWSILPGRGPAQVYLDEGRIYSVQVAGVGPTLGERLLACGALEPIDLEVALAAQDSDVPGWRLGELVVHLGFVGAEQVAQCLDAQLRELVAFLLAQPATPWRLRPRTRTRAAFATPLEVVPLLVCLGVDLLPTPSADEWVELPPLEAADLAAADLEVTDLEVTDLGLTELEAAPDAVPAVAMDRADALAALHDLDEPAEDGTAAAVDDEDAPAARRRPLDFLPRQRSGRERRGLFSRLLAKN